MNDNQNELPKNENQGELLNEEAMKCSCFGYNLDKLYHPMILVLLAGKDMHGYQIMKELERRREPDGEGPDSAGVYRMLKSMEKMELVRWEWRADGGGRPKKVYSITDAGRYGIRIWIDTLRGYKASIEGIIAEAEAVND